MKQQRNTRTNSRMAMLAALMSQSIATFAGPTREFKPGSILATTKDIEPGLPHKFKGKRSRRRRSARMRAAGYVHDDRLGWVLPEVAEAY